MKLGCVALLSALLVTGCVINEEARFDSKPRHSSTIDTGPYLLECRDGEAWFKNEYGDYVLEGECPQQP